MLVGEDGRLVEMAVAVGVFQPDDAVRLLGELLLDRVVGAGRIGDVEPALFVEVGDDGPIDQRRPGDQLDLEADGQREGVAVELEPDASWPAPSARPAGMAGSQRRQAPSRMRIFA